MIVTSLDTKKGQEVENVERRPGNLNLVLNANENEQNS